MGQMPRERNAKSPHNSIFPPNLRTRQLSKPQFVRIQPQKNLISISRKAVKKFYSTLVTKRIPMLEQK